MTGSWLHASGADLLESREPGNPRRVVGALPMSTLADVDAAVSAARAAMGHWAKLAPGARAQSLREMAAALRAQTGPLADLISDEVGKPCGEARGEVINAAGIFDYFAGQAETAAGVSLPGAGGSRMYTRREPVGVIAAITPWNFPVNSAAIKIAGALAFGNSVVLKPAEEAPVAAARLVELLASLTRPAGTVTMLVGPGEIGAALAQHQGVDAISFTGSTPVGQWLQRAGAERGVPVQCEMGGKNAMVVLADADLDLAASLAVDGAFRSAGQRCTATSRVIASADITRPLLERIVDRAKALEVGRPSATGTFLGPVISAGQRDRLGRAVDAAVADGATLELGGHALDPDDAGGYYFSPTILSGVTPDARVAQTELFGPVLCLIEVAGLEEAIAATNATEYGLTAAIVTRDIASANAFVDRAEVGAVAVNSTTAGWDYRVSFGGWKSSGSGHPEQGADAHIFFTRLKTVRLA